LYRRGQYRKAIQTYTEALELRDSDPNCLVARSRCYIKLGDTDNALKDAEASLAKDPTFYKGLYQKAEALYCKGDFEFALVFFHRGRRKRPELEDEKFRLGIQRAEKSIRDVLCAGRIDWPRTKNRDKKTIILHKPEEKLEAKILTQTSNELKQKETPSGKLLEAILSETDV